MSNFKDFDPEYTKVILVTRPGGALTMGNETPVKQAERIMREKHGYTDIVVHDAVSLESITIDINRPYLVVVLGGDGTFTTAARVFAQKADALIVGVQLGHVNFFNTFTLDTLAEIYIGNTRQVIREVGDVFLQEMTPLVFANDFVLKPADPTCVGTFTVYQKYIGMPQQEFVTKFKGDGLIVSTAAGSTAYNMSVGGPIIHPALKAFVLSPIAPIVMASRPTVVPAVDHIQYKFTCDQDYIVLLDGIQRDMLKAGFESTIDSYRAVRMLVPHDYNFFEQLHTKLGWHR